MPIDIITGIGHLYHYRPKYWVSGVKLGIILTLIVSAYNAKCAGVYSV